MVAARRPALKSLSREGWSTAGTLPRRACAHQPDEFAGEKYRYAEVVTDLRERPPPMPIRYGVAGALPALYPGQTAPSLCPYADGVRCDVPPAREEDEMTVTTVRLTSR